MMLAIVVCILNLLSFDETDVEEVHLIPLANLGKKVLNVPYTLCQIGW